MGQPKSTVDLRDVMDNGKVFIMNLSKGKIGEDNAALLGAMMITKIQLAAMDRARMPESNRQDFYLYVDEFQNFATESFAAILSEARKYRLNIIMAHQYITQMAEEVRDAVFGNVGTMISFRVGAFDAEYLEREYAPHFTETDLVNLDKYNAYIKLMIDGIASKPFSMTTIPFGGAVPYFGEHEKIIRVSRERFGRPREEVEERISRWSSATFRQAAEEESASYGAGRRGGGPSARDRVPMERSREVPESMAPVHGEELSDVVLESPRQSEPIQNLADVLARSEEPRRLKRVYPTTCDRCGRATEVPFEPTPGLAKYCRDCLAIVRAERRRVPVVPRAVGPSSGPSSSGAGAFSAGPAPPSPRPARDDDWEDPERK